MPSLHRFHEGEKREMPPAVPGFLNVEQVSVGYGGAPVLRDVSLSVSEGELVALLGSSGCGKTTLLRTVAGFAQPSSGAIFVGGKEITFLPPDRRDMALVFQSYALWPHMTVRQNIGYGLKLRRVPAPTVTAKVDEIIGMLGLHGLGDRNVTALSGGQRQRVALGRALAIDPRILLLDEPLSNLDDRIRQSVRHEIRSLQRRLGITAIHVTHDREEAMIMADRIVILNGGRIEQQGPPEEVYNAPATPFVAKFMGAENAIELPAVLSADRIDILAGQHNQPASLPQRARARITSPRAAQQVQVIAFFRSEAARLEEDAAADTAGGRPGEIVLSGYVTQVSYPGGIWRHTVQVGGQELFVDAPLRCATSQRVQVRLASDSAFLFLNSADPALNHLEKPHSEGVQEAKRGREAAWAN
jgi:putative spermidine/putrescine transport system ATP-binding protein